ncbi:MAG: HPP family protein [Flammeovirgaceae bacterium]|nr:HPP family protein [Flammeovirgaceae bacterium]MBE61208.1 HPP family protein [Flammeovirgaceae bacterium]MBR07103.1 HPP family protein [Rickettsiales bacterium]
MKNAVRRNLRIVRYILYRETILEKKEILWTFLGSFCGISLIGLTEDYLLAGIDVVFLIGSFGASSVLIFGAIQSPLAQPRNLVGGHLISSVVGVGCASLFGMFPMFAAALAVSLSILLMQISKTLHPPGGATALIAVTGSEQIKSLGWWYVLFPVLSGVIILLLIALLFNNLSNERKYPTTTRYTRVYSKRK